MKQDRTNLNVSKSDSLSSCWKCLLRQRFLCILRTSSSAPTYSGLLGNPKSDMAVWDDAESASGRTGGKAHSSNLKKGSRMHKQICYSICACSSLVLATDNDL